MFILPIIYQLDLYNYLKVGGGIYVVYVYGLSINSLSTHLSNKIKNKNTAKYACLAKKVKTKQVSQNLWIQGYLIQPPGRRHPPWYMTAQLFNSQISRMVTPSRGFSMRPTSSKSQYCLYNTFGANARDLPLFVIDRYLYEKFR